MSNIETTNGIPSGADFNLKIERGDSSYELDIESSGGDISFTHKFEKNNNNGTRDEFAIKNGVTDEGAPNFAFETGTGNDTELAGWGYEFNLDPRKRMRAYDFTEVDYKGLNVRSEYGAKVDSWTPYAVTAAVAAGYIVLPIVASSAGGTAMLLGGLLSPSGGAISGLATAALALVILAIIKKMEKCDDE